MPRQTRAQSLKGYIEYAGTATRDASAVIVKVDTEDGITLSASGSAKRNYGEQGDEAVGAMLATARALEALALKMRREIKGWI